MSKDREGPSGKVFVTFRVCKKHCSNVQSSRYLILPLSLSHLMNGAIGRRPAAAKVQSVSSQCKLRLLPRLICTSYPTARHNNSAIQCNNRSVVEKGIWVTGFLWLAQFATKLSLIGSSPLLSRIKMRIDKGKDKEKYQYKDKDKVKDKILK